MKVIDIAELEALTLACREGLMSLADAKGSTFYQFPFRACGVTSEIIGRVIWETLQFEGERVSGVHHPKLNKGVSHEWYEVGDFIVDITYDQFEDTGLTGWVFKKSNDGWHSQFPSQNRRQGFLSPSQWGAYPSDGYRAVLDKVKN